MTEQKTERFDILSSSESGLSYVREKRGGLMRVLTESELQDFNDPPPCPQCAEQFGCEQGGGSLKSWSSLSVRMRIKPPRFSRT